MPITNRLLLTSITRKKVIVVIAALTLIVAAASYLFYSIQAKKIKQEIYEELRYIAALKNDQVALWVRERTLDVIGISKSPAVAKLISGYLMNPSEKQKAEVLETFEFYQKHLLYENLFLFSKDGKLLINAVDSFPPFTEITKSKIEKVLKIGKYLHTDLYVAENGKVYYDFIGPVKNSKDEILGVVVFRRDPRKFLFPIIKKQNDFLKTSETAIIRNDKDSVVVLSELRYRKNKGIPLKIPKTRTDMPIVQAAIWGDGKIYEGTDYRGIKVMGVGKRIESQDWIIFTKVNESEIYGSLNFIAFVAFGFGFLVVILGSVTLVNIYNINEKNIFKQLYTKEAELLDNQQKLEQTEGELHKRDERLQRLLKELPEVVWSVTLDESRIVDVNESFEKVFGVNSDILKGDPDKWMDLVHPDDKGIAKRTNQELFDEGASESEYRILRPDGSIVWIIDRKSLVYNDKGDPIQIGGIARDITERKNAEFELLQAKEKAEEVSRLKTVILANMSHELKTPLIGIVGFADLLAKELTDEEHRGMAENIVVSGKHLSETINMILTYSRIDTNKMNIQREAVDLVKEGIYFAKFFNKMAEERGLKLYFKCSEPGIVIFSDLRAIHSIFNNLVNNAIKYTLKGSVTIDVSCAGSNASIKVIDTGIGISKENQKIVFEEFRQVSEGYSRSFEGIGLGLSITSKLVDKLGGKILLESIPDKGSVFTVELPIN